MTDLRRRSYFGICRGGVTVGDLWPPTRASRQKCQESVSNKSVLQKCQDRVSSKTVLQECRLRVSSVKQECLTKASRKRVK